MSAEHLPSNYYDVFSYSGWNLSLMISAFESLELPDHLERSLQHLPEATLLVLGSATTRNIGNIAVLDSKLRPGKSHSDRALMIDYNHYPMQQHRREWDWLQAVMNNEADRQDQMYLPYPDFVFVQADMRKLPLPDKSCDVVISDYTLNFLTAESDVTQTFSEVQRVLRPGGMMLLAVAGHEDVDPAIPLHKLQNTAAQRKERSNGLVTTQFPLQVYERSAALNGLGLQTANAIGHSYACAVLS